MDLNRSNRWRTTARLMLRAVHDVATGTAVSLAPSSESRKRIGQGFPERLIETQPVPQSDFWQNKVQNLRVAASRIQDVAISPGEIFSFWKMVGPPTRYRGYMEARTIISGLLESSIGGGICQLSGMLYSLALRAGLEICERHSHSVDIYTDATRFAPLGSDATVAYGYRDLRFRNTLSQAISFGFGIGDEQLDATLRAMRPIAEHTVEHRVIERTREATSVATYRRDGTDTMLLVCTSRYSAHEPGELES